MALSITTTVRDAEANATSDLLDGGKMKIYSGTPPANASTALSGNTLLATLTLNATFSGASSSGTITANAITSDSSADATGTATFARLTKSDDTVLMQGTVGTSGTDFTINTTSVVAGATVSCSSLTYTRPAS